MKAPHIDGRLERQASDVAARSRKTCDKAAANRVVCHGEHDRDLLCREECGSRRDNDIPFQLDELATLAPLRQALSYSRLSWRPRLWFLSQGVHVPPAPASKADLCKSA